MSCRQPATCPLFSLCQRKSPRVTVSSSTCPHLRATTFLALTEMIYITERLYMTFWIFVLFKTVAQEQHTLLHIITTHLFKHSTLRAILSCICLVLSSQLLIEMQSHFLMRSGLRAHQTGLVSAVSQSRCQQKQMRGMTTWELQLETKSYWSQQAAFQRHFKFDPAFAVIRVTPWTEILTPLILPYFPKKLTVPFPFLSTLTGRLGQFCISKTCNICFPSLHQ